MQRLGVGPRRPEEQPPAALRREREFDVSRVLPVRRAAVPRHVEQAAPLHVPLASGIVRITRRTDPRLVAARQHVYELGAKRRLLLAHPTTPCLCRLAPSAAGCHIPPMTGTPDNLVLEHLRAIRGDLAEVRRRMSNVEAELVGQGKLMALLLDKLGDIHADLHDLWTEVETSGEALGKDVAQIRINTAPD